MSVDLVLRQVSIAGDGERCDLAVDAGRIVAIAPALPLQGVQEIDGGGRVLGPGFVDSHVHLDKAYVSDRAANRSGTLQEAIAVTAALKPSFTREDIDARARRLLRRLIACGCSAVRAHAEFDPVQGFVGLDATLALRAEFAQAIDVQVVAFPQEGIFRSKGSAAMLTEAMRRGADVVGGIPYNDDDANAHIDFVFALAKDCGKDIDLHQDFADDANAISLEYLARKTIAAGYEGRVCVGHLTALGAVPPQERERLIALLREAAISVICLPATDLHLGGRNDAYNTRRALTPVRALRDGGVNVCLASNNVCNAFAPFGNGDPLQIAALALPACHLGGADDQASVLPMLTHNPARALRLTDYGLAVGNAADMVLFDTCREADIIVELPARALVFKRGRIVARTVHDTELSV